VAELSAVDQSAETCCSPQVLAECCDPGAKADCCDREAGCGCAAGATAADSGDDVRLRVREP
jgi:hypothetical protein